MSRRALGLAVAGAVALALVGCGSSDRYVCQDRLTHKRVSDDRCGDRGSLGAGWFLLRPGQPYPALGGVISPNSGATATPSKRPAPLPTKAGKAPAKPKTNLTKPKTGSGSGSKARSNGGSSRSGGGRR